MQKEISPMDNNERDNEVTDTEFPIEYDDAKGDADIQLSEMPNEGDTESDDESSGDVEGDSYDDETESSDVEQVNDSCADDGIGDGEKIKPEKPSEPPKTRVQKIFDITELFVLTLAAVLFLLSFVFRHSIVDGDSMNRTLFDGEHLIISDLFYTPDYGDIIVFEDYSTNLRKPLIKRVIALGGDEVRIDGNSVYVNGELLEEDYVYMQFNNYGGTNLTLTVPEGELFVMGDNRCNSTDSRMFGTIKESTVLGKVILRFSPIQAFGTVK